MDAQAPTAVTLGWEAFDFAATFIWAMSGGGLAALRGFDLTGIFAVALVSATGGGLLRDSLFLQNGPPALVRTPAYVSIVAVTALVIWIFGARIQRRLAGVTTVTDDIGLGAFAVVGVRLSMAAGLSAPAAILVGCVNAVGGGVLRSILLHEQSEIFRPGRLTALAAFLGCLAYVGCVRGLHVQEALSAALAVALVAAARVLSRRYRIETWAAPEPPSRTQDRP